MAKEMSRSDCIGTQLVLIRADIEEIRSILNGNGKGHKGLVYRINELVVAADRGRFRLRVILWLATGIVTAATGIVHFNQAIAEFLRQ
jgi:hypothetical protein